MEVVNNARKIAAQKRTAEALKKDPDYFRNLARKVRHRGARAAAPAGFAADPARARVAGAKGGQAKARKLAAKNEGAAPLRDAEGVSQE